MSYISIFNFYSHIVAVHSLIPLTVAGDLILTMDMDATIKGINLSRENIMTVFEDIIDTPVPDNVSFSIKGIEEIREDDEYGGYRVSLEAVFDTIIVPLKVDVSTDDVITPKEVVYRFTLMFEERSIEIFAYNLETVLAEKFETILSRGILNTRARDFYDVYILTRLQAKNICFPRGCIAQAWSVGEVLRVYTGLGLQLL